MIYYLDTKTLMEEFTDEHSPSEILDCEFVIVSTRINARDKEENVIKSKLYSEKLIFALDSDDHYENFHMVKDEILKSPSKIYLIIKMVTYALINKKTIVLLCSKNEMKTGYLRLVAEVTEKLFEYPVIDYKKDREKTFYYDPVVVAKKIKKIENEVTKRLLKDQDNRERALKLMSKKDMKKELKKIGLYSKDMDKSDMKDMLKTFFVEKDD